MGWSFCNNNDVRFLSLDDLVAQELRPYRVVKSVYRKNEDHSGGRGVMYVAAEQDGEVSAFVVLVSKTGTAVGFKVIHETCKPYYYGATKALIKSLTGPTNEWRKACLNN